MTNRTNIRSYSCSCSLTINKVSKWENWQVEESYISSITLSSCFIELCLPSIFQIIVFHHCWPSNICTKRIFNIHLLSIWILMRIFTLVLDVDYDCLRLLFGKPAHEDWAWVLDDLKRKIFQIDIECFCVRTFLPIIHISFSINHFLLVSI